jgi:predicted nucleic acid-binding protein
LGLESLRGFLRRHHRIALDTSILIYHLESNPRYDSYTDQIFSWLERPGSQAVTSTITMTELLVQPFRNSDERRVVGIYGLLSTCPNLEWIVPGLEIAALAARFRAIHRLRTPDALQAATAVNALATGLISNDPVFERVEGIETLILDKHLA